MLENCVTETATAAIELNSSQLLHIKDLKSDELFLVDSGAEVSIVRPTTAEKGNSKFDMSLLSVKGSPIATYGNRVMNLTFDNKTSFRRIFIIADIPHNILGIDFLQQNALVIDFAKMSEFSNITKPPNKDKPIKHDVVHEI